MVNHRMPPPGEPDPEREPSRPPALAEVLELLEPIHARILASRHGEPIDVDAALQECREERLERLLGSTGQE